MVDTDLADAGDPLDRRIPRRNGEWRRGLCLCRGGLVGLAACDRSGAIRLSDRVLRDSHAMQLAAANSLRNPALSLADIAAQPFKSALTHGLILQATAEGFAAPMQAHAVIVAIAGRIQERIVILPANYMGALLVKPAMQHANA